MFIAIIGPSGSGKSTLMNMIGCLDTPTEGKYWLDGEEVSRLKENKLAVIRNRKIGLIFQNFNLLPKLTALENVELPLIYRGVPVRQRREMALSALEKVGLGSRIDHKPMQLSGGQLHNSLSVALAGIAGISLLVGGIGIMNIMLVSVTERTREIGIRKAIGAKRRDILIQFLIESMVMSGMGGAIGIVFGVGGGVAVSKLLNMDVVFNGEVMLLAFAFSVFVGIVFGIFPANRAANLKPIDALRYE